jgi:hypothetical protein
MLMIAEAGVLFWLVARHREVQRRSAASWTAVVALNNARTVYTARANEWRREKTALAILEAHDAIDARSLLKAEADIRRAETASRPADVAAARRRKSELESARTQRAIRVKEITTELKKLQSELEKAGAERRAREANWERALAALESVW